MTIKTGKCFDRLHFAGGEDFPVSLTTHPVNYRVFNDVSVRINDITLEMVADDINAQVFEE